MTEGKQKGLIEITGVKLNSDCTHSVPMDPLKEESLKQAGKLIQGGNGEFCHITGAILSALLH